MQEVGQTSLADIYFQHQKAFSNQCGKCSLNNLIGRKKFTKDSLDQICYNLSKDIFNPHKHIFGGDYDGNVLMIALTLADHQGKWLDSRKVNEICQQSKLHSQTRAGYIVNKIQKSNSFTSLLGLSGRHWIAVRYLNQKYYLLDSKSEKKLAEPILNIAHFLKKEIQNGSHIFLINRIK